MGDTATIDDDTRRGWMRAQLRLDVELMRELGVAEWREIKLGPAPEQHDEERSTQQRFTADELEKRARDERRRISMASSGGPVKRVGGD